MFRETATRIATWWAATGEIDDLTRDHERDERIRAEAAVRLAPGAWAIADLFRDRRRRHRAGHGQGTPRRTTAG